MIESLEIGGHDRAHFLFAGSLLRGTLARCRASSFSALRRLIKSLLKIFNEKVV